MNPDERLSPRGRARYSAKRHFSPTRAESANEGGTTQALLRPLGRSACFLSVEESRKKRAAGTELLDIGEVVRR